MMRALEIVLLLLVASSAVFAQSGRWEYIVSDDRGGKFFLDIRTVDRPQNGVVIFWLKKETAAASDMMRIKMWLNTRKMQRVDEPSYMVEDIAPDSVHEVFWERLNRNR